MKSPGQREDNSSHLPLLSTGYPTTQAACAHSPGIALRKSPQGWAYLTDQPLQRIHPAHPKLGASEGDGQLLRVQVVQAEA